MRPLPGSIAARAGGGKYMFFDPHFNEKNPQLTENTTRRLKRTLETNPKRTPENTERTRLETPSNPHRTLSELPPGLDILGTDTLAARGN